MKRVLIVSPHFPPSTLAGVHRARILAKYLPEAGWRPTILCVHEDFHKETIDPGLAALLPRALDVVKTKALPYPMTRWTGIGDISLRAFYHMKTALRRLLDADPVDAIFMTGLPYYPMLLSGWLKRRYGRPIILDFQDPWVSAFGAGQPRFSKIGIAHRLAKRLEPRVLRNADFITSVSDLQNTDMARRYPWLDAGKMTAIPIGGDAADYKYLKEHDRPCTLIDAAPGHFTIGYVGNVWPGAYRTLEALFAAVAQIKKERPQLYERLRLVFVGSSNQPTTSAAEVVMPFARRAGISENVFEQPGRIPYLDALNVMVRSDLLLMLGSDEPHYTASKLYPTLLAERPVLAIFHEHSSVCSISEAVGGVMLLRFSNASPVETKLEQIAQALAAFLEGRDTVPPVHRDKFEPYLGPSIARRFAEIFDRVQLRR